MLNIVSKIHITLNKEKNMKATVDADLCIGCQACVDACDTVFEMDGDKAVVVATPVPTDSEDACKEAAEMCPVDAIKVE